MKKAGRILAVTCIILLSFSFVAFAKNNVAEINIHVTIQDDGSAYIVQTWRGDFHEGTENYIPIRTDGIEIRDLRVSDEWGEYEFVKEWNIHAKFEEKARKCGIHETSDGVELCFGISEYGTRQYAIEYIVKDFIKAYTDYDGTNFMLVNPDMSTFPTDCKVDIIFANGTELTEENAGIWGFGYEGYAEFSNGKVIAYTTSALEGDNCVILMLRLAKGIIAPTAKENFSFDEVKNRAMEGSDYFEKASFLETLGACIVIFLILVILVSIVVSYVKRKRAIKKFYQESNYFRDIPNHGDITISHFLAQRFDVSKEKSLIIGAVLLSMINQGEIEAITIENVGMFGKVKEHVSLKLIKEPEDVFKRALYAILVEAAGEDGIVQERELEKYTFKNPQKLKSFMDNAEAIGGETFTLLGGYIHGRGNRIKDLSDQGKAELAEVMGLKKYLEDFSLISEREIQETEIWQDYMVYAMLFNIADKVKEQFEKVYPEKIEEIETYNRNVILCHSYYHTMHRSYQKSVQAQRNAGGGGGSSIGGGGGFSGGGFGGGSR